MADLAEGWSNKEHVGWSSLTREDLELQGGISSFLRSHRMQHSVMNPPLTPFIAQSDGLTCAVRAVGSKSESPWT